MPHKSIAIYTRVSTADQAAAGLSLEVQAAACSEHAQRFFPDVATTLFSDTASAASTSKRAALLRALAMRRSLSALVVLRLDRLARNTLDLLRIIETLDDANVALHSVRENIDTAGAAGRLFITVLGAMAQFERDLIAQRTSEALRAKQARGEWVGRLPFGFASRDLDIDPHDINIVRQIYLLAKVGASHRTIGRTLNVKPSTVRHVLSNEIYRSRGLL
jgi:site-specific DNA recombinase